MNGMDVCAGGQIGHVPSLLFKRLGQSVPFHATRLPSLKTLKLQKRIKKYPFPAILEDLSLNISRGSMPPDPLGRLLYSIPQTKC